MEKSLLEHARSLRHFSKAISFKPNRNLLIEEVGKLQPIMTFPKIGQEVYAFYAEESAALMGEIGRLRENCWRFYGFSMGSDIDIDFYDTYPDSSYRQVFVWNKNTQEILGGCRYVSLVEMKRRLGKIPPQPRIHTFEIFTGSDLFMTHYLPRTLELQRVFIIPRIGPNLLDTSLKHSPFVLDNLFKALGQKIISEQGIAYVTGRATFPPSLFEQATIHKIIELLHHNISRYDLLLPKPPYQAKIADVSLPTTAMLPTYRSPSPKSISLLQKEYDANDMPIILKVYLNLSNKIFFFGGILHKEMNNATEVAIMVSIKDFFKKKKERYFTPAYITKLEDPAFITEEPTKK